MHWNLSIQYMTYRGRKGACGMCQKWHIEENLKCGQYIEYNMRSIITNLSSKPSFMLHYISWNKNKTIGNISISILTHNKFQLNAVRIMSDIKELILMDRWMAANHLHVINNQVNFKAISEGLHIISVPDTETPKQWYPAESWIN